MLRKLINNITSEDKLFGKIFQCEISWFVGKCKIWKSAPNDDQAKCAITFKQWRRKNYTLNYYNYVFILLIKSNLSQLVIGT